MAFKRYHGANDWLIYWLVSCSILWGKILVNLAVADTSYELSKIDEGTAWVSSYWGYNAPKLVYDGEYFYTVALWGDTQATATGAIYSNRDGQWQRGYSWEGLNYQPGMVLLDSAQRLVLIYPQISGGPVILRSRAQGDMVNFDSIAVPSRLKKAGYIGAGIYDDRIVLGYIGDPETYSFNIAILDLKTMAWEGPHVLAPAQRQEEPWTTWLYPIILPDAKGVHMTVSNQPDPTATYNTILYMYLPYDRLDTPEPEIVAQVHPWSDNMAFAEAMWRATDGSIYITGQHKPEAGENFLYVYRRDPISQTWSGVPISTSQIAAVFQDQQDRLWLTSTFWDALRLYTSEDQGASWDAVGLSSFEPYDFVSSFFLHGIHAGSGSLMPQGPAAVFSAGQHPQYQLWFVHFSTFPVVTAVGDENTVIPSSYQMAHNYPNPFNSNTIINFVLSHSEAVELTVYNLAGQMVVTLVDKICLAGTYKIPWNGKDTQGHQLSSGIYLYRLRVGTETETRKFALIR